MASIRFTGAKQKARFLQETGLHGIDGSLEYESFSKLELSPVALIHLRIGLGAAGSVPAQSHGEPQRSTQPSHPKGGAWRWWRRLCEAWWDLAGWGEL